ncbi:hypothetical protein [Ulvibacterium sp.]|uniref:hypothetical protein n=1 Tax=Ulvibacterium sp. TaxID=2665914 RepID=UPI002609BB8C|nr:hypothetical protein [Ulvibacterium sp.]
MKTRKNFLDWVSAKELIMENEMDQPKFYAIHEQKYVYGVLSEIIKSNPGVKAFVEDFGSLENQRYDIVNKRPIQDEYVISQAGRAIDFCAQSDTKKRKSSFLVNPELTNYLVHSTFLWNNIENEDLKAIPTYYLMIPTILDVAPKEICLTQLNALLLDIKDYGEVFTYGELLESVAGAMDYEEKELDKLLLDFVTAQVLYYQTLFPII